MADIVTVIGSRDDLVMDASRCLRMRFRESSCRCCIDICTHGAVTLENGLAVNPDKCRGCLLCTSACPAGALEQNTDFSACMAQLSRVPDPVLGCISTKNNSNATLTCLGGLSEEHLLALGHTLAGRLTLNLSKCEGCSNCAMIPVLRERLNALYEAKLFCAPCRIEIAESAQDVHCRDESVDRRYFFKSFGRALFQNVAVILSSSKEETERHTEYAGKRSPYRRELLRNTREKFSPELEGLIRKRFDSSASFAKACSNCQGCVAICPTGALHAESSVTPPDFDQRLCTGCGLCQEFCLDNAVRITQNSL